MLTISFFGDFFCTSPQDLYLSSELQTLIRSTDIACCNFEAPIESHTAPINKTGPSIQQPLSAAQFLEDSGFNFISLANNHIGDYGDLGIEVTRKAFNKSKLIGAGTFDQAYRVEVIEKNNLRVGFIALTQHEFGIIKSTTQSNTTHGAAWIHDSSVETLIKNSKQKCDVLFVITHAGLEEVDYPLPEWRESYRRILDWGADAIIGSHPHVPQGWEFYKGKAIFYSLGNFVFSMSSCHPFGHHSLGVIAKIQSDMTITYEVHYIQQKDHSIQLVSDGGIQSHCQVLCDTLLNESKYQAEVDAICIRAWNEIYLYSYYYGLFAIPYSFKIGFVFMLKSIYRAIFFRKKHTRMINLLQCETHHWCALRGLRLLENVRKN